MMPEPIATEPAASEDGTAVDVSPARCGKRIAIDGGFLFRDPANPELWCSVLYVAESDNFLILRGARWVDVPALFPDLTSEPTPGDVAFVPDPASPTEPR